MTMTAKGALVFAGASLETKTDVYGARQDSPINNPSAGRRRGEPIPTPGNPARFPSYLKPIPINTRNIEREMRRYLETAEPRLMRVLYSTWNADRNAIKYQEIRNAIRDGQFSEDFLSRFRQSYSAMIAEKMRPEWEAAIARSSGLMGESIRSRFGAFPRFDAANERLLSWYQARGVELAVQLSNSQTQALRGMLRYYTTERPVGARELGRLIRATVGLTPKQAQAVAAFREGLASSGGLTPQQIENQVQNYAGRLHRIRAERIARTELSWAFNQGGLEQMRQAQADVFAGEPIVKRWLTGRDERVCDHCGPLDGEVIGLEETFPGATVTIPNTFTPPAHPGCRCTLIYSVLRE
jgi:SPP1 gp7 family putative phage head morphogenesis protein